MKLWIDDVRNPPGALSEGWIWITEVNAAKRYITIMERGAEKGHEGIELIDIDHDAGDFAPKVATTSSCSTGLRRLVATIPFGFIRKML